MSNQTEELNRLVEDWASAEIGGDTVSLGEILAEDFVGVGPRGFVLTGEQWISRHEAGNLKYGSFGLDGEEVRAYGDAAIVVCRQTAAGVYEDENGRYDIDESFRATLVFVRKDENWRLAGLQLSPSWADRSPPIERAEAEGDPVQNMQNKMMIETWVRYTHLEKLYGYLPGMDEELLARIFGLGVEEYREVKHRFEANARDAALELLEDAPFAGRVDRLPFREGDTVVGVGDSMTDDLQSWLEIVRHLLQERRPGDEIRVVNRGLSAHTTAMVLRRFAADVVSLEPDCILCLLGGNDATRVGPEPNKPQVGIEETAKNLEAMRRIVRTQTEAEWVWITPPTYDEERASSFPPFKMGQSVFTNRDIVAIGDFVREQEEPVVDLQAVFGLPADPELQGPDGVHPSLAGQKAIARAFVERLKS